MLYLTHLAVGPRGAVVGALTPFPIVGVTAAALAWRAGEARGVGAAVRRGWRLMALAHLPVVVASVAWGAYLAAGRSALPGWLDWATLAFYPQVLALALGVAIGADFLYANQTLRGAYAAGG